MRNRLLLHLPATENSSRKFLVPVFKRQDIVFNRNENILASLKYNQVVKGKLVDRDAAVKIIPWNRADLAWNEVEIFSYVPKHRYLLDFLGIAQEKDESLLILTELVSPSVTLEEHLAGNSISEFRWLTQIAQVMAHLHSRGIVHRDLKAANILLTKDSIPKLADFDRAAVLKENNFFEEPCGSLFHMAPEILRVDQCRYNHKVDIYAFGILIFEVTHRSSPYPGLIAPGIPGSMTKEEFAEKVQTGGLRPKWTLPDANNLKRLAERCWAFSPEERPEFEEIAEVLQRDYPADPPKPVYTGLDLSLSQNIGTTASIGHVRERMEDALAILQTDDPRTVVCGVFDGLRRSRSAEFAARKFALNMLEHIKPNESEKMLLDALKDSLERTDSTLKRLVPEVDCGSTATVSVITDNRICVGWLGDSSSYLFRKTPGKENHYQAISLIDKHAPNRPDELERIDANKGTVERETACLDNGERIPIGPWRAFTSSTGESENRSKVGIAVSRALGLFKFRPVISGEGEFVALERKKGEDSFLILASDGLWDLLDLTQVIETMVAANFNSQAATDLLVKQVLDRGAHDNVSVVIVRLDDESTRSK